MAATLGGHWAQGLQALALGVCTSMSMATTVLAETPIRFIAIGDMPYQDAEQDSLTTELRRAISAANVPFVVHYGDLKGGGESCTDALLTVRRNDIWSLQPGRVFFTPGDNEWTDCDRDTLETSFSEIERLAKIRDLFFAEPMDLPDNWAYVNQPHFPENARWQQGDVVFLTLHLVGTNNGRQNILLDDPGLALAMVEARDHANRVWLNNAFEQADQVQARALVMVTQADVSDPDGSGPCTPTNPSECDAYLGFREQLMSLAARFDKPVLLIHGDTNPYCLDREFGGAITPKLWRLNAWGDFQDPADATDIVIQPTNPEQPFTIQTLMGQQQPAMGCQPET